MTKPPLRHALYDRNGNHIQVQRTHLEGALLFSSAFRSSLSEASKTRLAVATRLSLIWKIQERSGSTGDDLAVEKKTCHLASVIMMPNIS